MSDWDTFMSTVQGGSAEKTVIDAQTSANSPWALNADEFLATFNQAATDQTPDGLSGWADMNNKDQSVQLKLPSGKTWHPSGANSGMIFTPKGTVIPGAQRTDKEGTVLSQAPSTTTTEDTWTVKGDMSALLGRDATDTHATVVYHKVGDKMIPVETPVIKQWHPDHMIRNAAAVFAVMCLTAGAATGAFSGAGAAVGGATTGEMTAAQAMLLEGGSTIPEIASATGISGESLASLGGTGGATSGAVTGESLASLGGTAGASSAAVVPSATTIGGTATVPGAMATAVGGGVASVVGGGAVKATIGSLVAGWTGSDALGGVIDGASTFLSSDLGKSILGGIGSAFTAEQVKEIADGKNQNNIDLANINNTSNEKIHAATNATSITTNAATNKNNLEVIAANYANVQNDKKIYSDSITGLTPATYKDPTSVTRFDGSQVFNPDGTLISPNKGIIQGAMS